MDPIFVYLAIIGFMTWLSWIAFKRGLPMPNFGSGFCLGIGFCALLWKGDRLTAAGCVIVAFFGWYLAIMQATEKRARKS